MDEKHSNIFDSSVDLSNKFALSGSIGRKLAILCPFSLLKFPCLLVAMEAFLNVSLVLSIEYLKWIHSAY